MLRSRDIALQSLRTNAPTNVVAVIALLAIVIEACVGAPLSFLMAQSAGFPFGIDGAICSPGSTQQSGDRQQPAPSHSGDHAHNQCLLCHAGTAPAIVVAADHAPFPPVVRTSATSIAVVSSKAATRPPPYISRAPPLNA